MEHITNASVMQNIATDFADSLQKLDEQFFNFNGKAQVEAVGHYMLKNS